MISTLCADSKCVFPHLDCRHAVSLRCSNPCLITECDSNTAKYCPVSTHVHNLGQLGLICPASSSLFCNNVACFCTPRTRRQEARRDNDGHLTANYPKWSKQIVSDWACAQGLQGTLLHTVRLIAIIWRHIIYCEEFPVNHDNWYLRLHQDVFLQLSPSERGCRRGHAFCLLSDSCPWIM